MWFARSVSWDISYALYEPRRQSAIKGKARSGGDHLTLSIIHMSLCMCIWLCNFISSSIVFQYHLGKTFILKIGIKIIYYKHIYCQAPKLGVVGNSEKRSSVLSFTICHGKIIVG